MHHGGKPRNMGRDDGDDAMTLSQSIFAGNVSKLIRYINEQGYTCTFGEAWRTPEMAEIYAKRGTGIKRSLHCERRAIDLNLFLEGKYLTDGNAHKPFGDYWESLDPRNRWGGRFNDGNHYEMREAI